MAASHSSQSNAADGVDDQERDFKELERLLREAPEPKDGKQTVGEWIDEQEAGEESND